MSSSFTSTITNMFYNGLVVVTVIVVAGVGLLYVNQNSLLYMPSPPGFPKTPEDNPNDFRSPREYNEDGKLIRVSDRKSSVDFEENFIVTSDNIRIHTWLILHKYATAVPTLVCLYYISCFIFIYLHIY